MYFTKIEDGKELRRALLEGSKVSIQVLKLEPEFEELRAKKRLLFTQVHRDLKELTFLLGEVEKVLPTLTKKELRELFPEPPKPKPKKGKKGAKGKKKAGKGRSGKGKKKGGAGKATGELPEAPVAKELTKLQKLESALEKIENRLDKL